jgi:hypothetical protein
LNSVSKVITAVENAAQGLAGKVGDDQMTALWKCLKEYHNKWASKTLNTKDFMALIRAVDVKGAETHC